MPPAVQRVPPSSIRGEQGTKGLLWTLSFCQIRGAGGEQVQEQKQAKKKQEQQQQRIRKLERSLEMLFLTHNQSQPLFHPMSQQMLDQIKSKLQVLKQLDLWLTKRNQCFYSQ